MEKIIIKGLKLFAYHGVNPEEKMDGQNFVLDITALLNADKAKQTVTLSIVGYSFIIAIPTLLAAVSIKSYFSAQKTALAVLRILA